MNSRTVGLLSRLPCDRHKVTLFQRCAHGFAFGHGLRVAPNSPKLKPLRFNQGFVVVMAQDADSMTGLVQAPTQSNVGLNVTA